MPHFRPLADVVRIGKVGWRAGIHGHLPEDNTCVPRADVHWTRPKPPQWTLSRHSVRPTAKQTGIFAYCRIYPAPPLLAFRSARRLPGRLLNNFVDWWHSAPGWAPFRAGRSV
jgi:hypothetical protein